MNKDRKNSPWQWAMCFLLLSADGAWVVNCADEIILSVDVTSFNSSIAISTNEHNAIVSVPENVNVTLRCSVDQNVGFLINGTSSNRLTRLGSTPTYTIVEVLWPRDSRLYGCKDLSDSGPSFTLSVEVAPNILGSSVTRQSRDLGSAIQLNCTVYGNPKPTVWWEKTTSLIQAVSYASDELLNGQTIPVAHNELIINISTTDSYGNYSCHANNTVGLTERVFELMPPELPRVVLDTQSLLSPVISGSNSSIVCRVSGQPQPAIIWQKDGQEMNDLQSLNVHSGSNRSVLVVSQLILTNVSVFDAGYYTCVATTGPYRATQGTEVVVVGIPYTPHNVTAINVTSSTITVSFSIITSVDAPIIRSSIWLRTANHDSWQKARETVTNGSTRQVVIDDLQPFTRYQIRVVSWNIAGRSGFSNIVQFTTSEAEPNASPMNVTITPSSSTSLYVEWKDLPRQTWNGPGRGYYLRYQREDGFMRMITALNYTMNTSSQLSALVTKLQKYTYYNVSLALFNQKGTGRWSFPVSVRTKEDVPDVGPHIDLLSVLFKYAVLRWSPIPSAHTNGQLVGYKLALWSVGRILWNDTVLENTTLYNITSLSQDTSYEIRIAAATRSGDGPYTTEVFKTNQATEASTTDKATTVTPPPSSFSPTHFMPLPTPDYIIPTSGSTGLTADTGRPTPDSVGDLDVTLIAATTAASAVVFALLLVVGCCYLKRRRKTRKAILYRDSEIYSNGKSTEMRARAPTFKTFEEVNPLAENRYQASPSRWSKTPEEASIPMATTTTLQDAIQESGFSDNRNVDLHKTNDTANKEDTPPVVPPPPSRAEVALKRPSTRSQSGVEERPLSIASTLDDTTGQYAEVPRGPSRRMVHNKLARNGEGSLIQIKGIRKPQPDYVEVQDTLNQVKKADGSSGRTDISHDNGGYEIVQPAVSRESRHRQKKQSTLTGNSTDIGSNEDADTSIRSNGQTKEYGRFGPYSDAENGMYESCGPSMRRHKEGTPSYLSDVRPTNTAMIRAAEEAPNCHKKANGEDKEIPLEDMQVEAATNTDDQ